MTRVVILAAGEATRWGDHAGVPKHFVDVGGIPLLHRTVNQFSPYGEVIVTSQNDDRYKIEGAEQYVVEPITESWDTKKFLDNYPIWSKNGRTILLWGDTYYSENAVNSIIDNEPADWLVYGRMNASEITGCGYGEIFAYSFTPQSQTYILTKIRYLRWLRRHHRIGRCGGWELYRALSGADDLNKHTLYNNFIEIDDETEDFDFPHDYDMWRERVLGAATNN